MRMMRRSLLAGMASAAAMGARAQDTPRYPRGPVRLIVPYVPGGATDVQARALAQRLGVMWGQTVLVESRPGGNTVIATEAVAKAAPDGHTLLLAAMPFALNPAMYDRLPYDTAVDILREHGLHLRGQAVEPLSHVSRAAGQVHPRARRRPEHQRPPSSASTPRSTATSTQPLVRTVMPDGNTTSMTPGSVAASCAGAGASTRGISGATATGTKPDTAAASISLRQVYSCPVLTPFRSATACTTAPAASVSRTIRSLSSSGQLRRRTGRTRTSTPRSARTRTALFGPS